MAGPPAPAPAPAAAGALGVLTYNICTHSAANGETHCKASYSIDEKLRLIAQEIQRVSPSIICLQEVGAAHDARLARLLAPAYTRVCSVTAHAGSTVLYMQPGLQPRAEQPRPPVAIASIPLAAAAAACGLPAAAAAGDGERVWVLGCHLIFGENRQGKRVQQAAAALASLPPNARFVVLAGDTNFHPKESFDESKEGEQPLPQQCMCWVGGGWSIALQR